MTSDSALARAFAHLRREVDQIKKGQRVAHGASIENAALEVRDGAGEIRAVVGVQPDGTVGVVAQNGPPPGALSAPVVTPAIAGLRVVWDGALADGATLPLDFDHVAVYVSTSSGFTPSSATFAGTITRAGDGGMLPVTPLPYAAHYVVLVGVNTSGIGGAPSAETAGTPVQVDGPDLTAGSVTAEAIAAGAVEADKLAAILVVATRILAGDPAGARVELNSDGLKVYDGTGTLKVFLDAATGSSTFTGSITGSDITGGTVTGSTVRTGTTGRRVILNPAASDPSDEASASDTTAAVEVHSGAVSQVTPGMVVADVDSGSPALPYASLYGPSLIRDGFYGFPITANLRLTSPEFGTRGGEVYLRGNNALSGDESSCGDVSVSGYTSESRTGDAHLEMYCQSGDQATGGDGSGLGPRSWVQLDGAQAQMRAATATGNSTFTLTTSAATSSAPIKGPNIRQSRTQVPAPGTGGGTTTATVTFSVAMSATPRVVLTPETTVDPNTVTIRAYADNVTTSGFTIRCYRSTNSATNVSWIALSD